MRRRDAARLPVRRTYSVFTSDRAAANFSETPRKKERVPARETERGFQFPEHFVKPAARRALIETQLPTPFQHSAAAATARVPSNAVSILLLLFLPLCD